MVFCQYRNKHICEHSRYECFRQKWRLPLHKRCRFQVRVRDTNESLSFANACPSELVLRNSLPSLLYALKLPICSRDSALSGPQLRPPAHLSIVETWQKNILTRIDLRHPQLIVCYVVDARCKCSTAQQNTFMPSRSTWWGIYWQCPWPLWRETHLPSLRLFV